MRGDPLQAVATAPFFLPAVLCVRDRDGGGTQQPGTSYVWYACSVLCVVASATWKQQCSGAYWSACCNTPPCDTSCKNALPRMQMGTAGTSQWRRVMPCRIANSPLQTLMDAQLLQNPACQLPTAWTPALPPSAAAVLHWPFCAYVPNVDTRAAKIACPAKIFFLQPARQMVGSLLEQAGGSPSSPRHRSVQLTTQTFLSCR